MNARFTWRIRDAGTVITIPLGGGFDHRARDAGQVLRLAQERLRTRVLHLRRGTGGDELQRARELLQVGERLVVGDREHSERLAAGGEDPRPVRRRQAARLQELHRREQIMGLGVEPRMK